jgi:hypothetical protein
MQIDRMAMALRPRNPWEGADLGVAMLRAWWRPVYAAAACVIVPIALAAHLAFDNALVALLIVWWLKPLYDRVLLHVLSRALFGAAPSVRQTLSGIPELARRSGLVGALTIRRLDIARSFNLPVRQLEYQSGVPARNRERVLGRRTTAQTTALLYCCIAFEVIVAASLAALLHLLTPATLETEFGTGAFIAALFDPAGAGNWRWLNNALLIIAIWAIEPLYVAAGFALYLNRRTTLEAWDLELRFRRVQPQPRGLDADAAVLLASLAFCSGMFLGASDVQAAPQSSQEIIAEVLAAPEFQEYRTQKVWQPIATDQPQSNGSFSFDLSGWLGSLGTSAAQLLRLLAYTALACALFVALRFLWRELRFWKARGTPTPLEPRAPDVVFGMDVRPEALPADLAELARASAAADPRLALSLLYRGALVTLIHRDRLHIEHGDTEADCVRRVAATGPAALAAYFARLVGAWSRTAYGHRPPQPEQVAELCVQWPQHFAASGQP